MILNGHPGLREARPVDEFLMAPILWNAPSGRKWLKIRFEPDSAKSERTAGWLEWVDRFRQVKAAAGKMTRQLAQRERQFELRRTYGQWRELKQEDPKLAKQMGFKDDRSKADSEGLTLRMRTVPVTPRKSQCSFLFHASNQKMALKNPDRGSQVQGRATEFERESVACCLIFVILDSDGRSEPNPAGPPRNNQTKGTTRVCT